MTKAKISADDIDDDDNDKDSITKKSGFWKWAKKEKQKISIISGIFGGIAIIWTTLTPIVNDFITNKHTIDTLTQMSKKHEDRILKQHTIIDSMKTNEKIYKYHIIILNDIIRASMQDIIIDGVHFKRSQKGKLYYANANGILFAAQLDGNFSRYFYEDYDGTTYWCK